MELRLSILRVLLASMLCWFVVLSSLSHGSTVEEVALLKGPERQKVLEAGAKKEGKVVWYTTLIVNQAVRPLKEAFEKKYPFLEVEFFRGNSTKVAQRMATEYQAGRHDVDIIDGTSSTPLVKKIGLLQRFASPALAGYPDVLRDQAGYWGVSNLYFMTLGYNTNLVNAAEVPKTKEDLLDPKWKGKMIWSSSAGSGAPVFIGNVLLTMGEEKGMAYLRKLAKQKIAKTTASARAILDQVAAGEYSIGIHMFNHHALISQEKGAPVDWQPVEPVTGLLQTVGLGKNAPHPHAAMLFIDFLLSEEGQNVLKQAGYLPSQPKVPATHPELKPGGGRFDEVLYIDPSEHLENRNRWLELFKELFFQ